VFLFVGLHRRYAPAAAASAAPVFELRAINGASFHDETAGPDGRAVLSSGSLAVHVEHLLAAQSFVLCVPDGELRARHSRFIVDVSRVHTERILVTEGVVVVRLAGSPERRLAAGESWTRRNPQPAVADIDLLVDTVSQATLGRGAKGSERPGETAHFQPKAASTPTERGATTADGRFSSSTRRRRDSTRKASSKASDDARGPTMEISMPMAATRATALGEFATAMAAFTAGAYLDADDLFSAFAARFPTDARNEDVAFLRAVIATKRGDATAAVARARDYLRRFPDGLRRDEMERILTQPW
jgi:hypothetical protein